ncbi:hypothetical protein C4J81_18810 (plasmid) [Deltaproteobacteria bacterium Smac51]|nr:hypothetical protein C4J81_18810 [Deltaproteobacteria bacterium Smac51]
MRCLLILQHLCEKKYSYIIPQGVAIISAVVKKIEGVERFTLNLNYPEFYRKKDRQAQAVLAALDEYKPDVVMCGGQVDNFKDMFAIFETVKAYDENIITVAGGLLISGAPAPAMEALENVDYGIVGEGELTVAELLTAIKAGASASQMEKVHGLVIKRDGGFICTPPRALITDWVKDIPWADYDSFGRDEIVSKGFKISDYPNSTTLYMTSTRGCVAKCTFCYNPFSGKLRLRPLDDFFGELENLIQKYGKRYVFICDDLFAVSTARVRDFCLRMKEFELNSLWMVFLRVPQVNSENLRLLEDAGCEALAFGFESIHDTVLQSMEKKVNFKQIEKALHLARDSKLNIAAAIIIGDPAEDYEMALESIKWRDRAGLPKNVLIKYTMLMIMPGSRLYHKYVKEGRIKDEVEYIKNYSTMGFMNVSKMTDDEYFDIYDRIASFNEPGAAIDSNNLQFEYNFRAEDRTATWTCHVCGKTARKVYSIREIQGQCPHCDAIVSLPRLESLNPELIEYDRIKANIEALLARHGSIVFWGAGQFLKTIPEDFLRSENIILADKTVAGNEYAGKTIKSTDEIAALEPGCIVVSVVPATPASREIYAAIDEKFPNLKECPNLWELNFRSLG